MLGEIHSDFFTAFFLATLKKIVRDHPDSANEQSLRMGAKAGQRLADDAFREFLVYERIADAHVDRYLVLFFKHYLGAAIRIQSKTLVLNEPFADFGGECGYWFLCGVLTSIFGYMRPGIVFDAVDRTIVYRFIED